MDLIIKEELGYALGKDIEEYFFYLLHPEYKGNSSLTTKEYENLYELHSMKNRIYEFIQYEITGILELTRTTSQLAVFWAEFPDFMTQWYQGIVKDLVATNTKAPYRPIYSYSKNDNSISFYYNTSFFPNLSTKIKLSVQPEIGFPYDNVAYFLCEYNWAVMAKSLKKINLDSSYLNYMINEQYLDAAATLLIPDDIIDLLQKRYGYHSINEKPLLLAIARFMSNEKEYIKNIGDNLFITGIAD